MVLEKPLESPLNCKEIQPVHPKGNQSWMFIGRTDAEAETPILWPPDEKSWLSWKDPDAGKDWRQEEKEMTEDEMVGWHHWLSGHEFEQIPGDSEEQRSLGCCSSWGQLNNNNNWQKIWIYEYEASQYDFKSLIISSYFKSNYTVGVRFIININECKFILQMMVLILFIDFPNTPLHSDASPNIPDMGPSDKRTNWGCSVNLYIKHTNS